MKSHISATIDRDILSKVDRYRRTVKRSRSQVIELAVERFLHQEQPESSEILTSEGDFMGNFSRAETYER
jgi:metal-responsive CopG/Arc/MetJ family transcriptional regulator